MLAGTTRDECRLSLFLPPAALEQVNEVALSGFAAAHGLENLSLYRAAPTPGDGLAAALGDSLFLLSALRVADARQAGGTPTWLYRFDALEQQDNGAAGSCHTADTPFFFDTLDHPTLRARLGEHPSRAAAEVAHHALVRFVRDGDPGWPRYAAPTRTTALLGNALDVVDDPSRAERAAWAR